MDSWRTVCGQSVDGQCWVLTLLSLSPGCSPCSPSVLGAPPALSWTWVLTPLSRGPGCSPCFLLILSADPALPWSCVFKLLPLGPGCSPCSLLVLGDPPALPWTWVLTLLSLGPGCSPWGCDGLSWALHLQAKASTSRWGPSPPGAGLHLQRGGPSLHNDSQRFLGHDRTEARQRHRGMHVTAQ